MPAGRVLATQQARDAANQLLALTGAVKEQVRRVLQHGGILADPYHWEGGLAGKWRHEWGPDANQLNQAVAKRAEPDPLGAESLPSSRSLDWPSLGPESAMIFLRANRPARRLPRA
ncbi:MAG: hypothetical protein ACRDRX_27365 [Pseudonocardiaceae bacterium]